MNVRKIESYRNLGLTRKRIKRVFQKVIETYERDRGTGESGIGDATLVCRSALWMVFRRNEAESSGGTFPVSSVISAEIVTAEEKRADSGTRTADDFASIFATRNVYSRPLPFRYVHRVEKEIHFEDKYSTSQSERKREREIEEEERKDE